MPNFESRPNLESLKAFPIRSFQKLKEMVPQLADAKFVLPNDRRKELVDTFRSAMISLESYVNDELDLSERHVSALVDQIFSMYQFNQKNAEKLAGFKKELSENPTMDMEAEEGLARERSKYNMDKVLALATWLNTCRSK